MTEKEIPENEKKTCELCQKLGQGDVVDGKCCVHGCLQSDMPQEHIILRQAQKVRGRAEAIRSSCSNPEMVRACKAYAEDMDALADTLRDHAALHR